MKQQWKRLLGTIGIAVVAVVIVVLVTLQVLFGSIDNGCKMVRALYLVRTQYLHRLSSDQITTGMIAGLIKSADDPHSEYLPQQAYHRLQEAIEGKHVGVGLLLSQKDGAVIVQEVIPGGSAQRSGQVYSGDRINRVDGELLNGLTLPQVVERISGAKDTSVVLDMSRAQGGAYSVTLKREAFVVPTVNARLLTPHIGYIRIRNFTEETPTDFRKEYENLRFNGMRKLVIDLRDNPGGSLHAVTDIAKQLLPRGVLVQVVSRTGKMDAIELPGAADPVPLVVIVNARSASASEILASAVQDFQVGTIVGEPSYGKGTVQGVFALSDTDGARLTVAEYLSSKGRRINGKGVIPDRKIDAALSEEDWIAAAIQAF